METKRAPSLLMNYGLQLDDGRTIIDEARNGSDAEEGGIAGAQCERLDRGHAHLQVIGGPLRRYQNVYRSNHSAAGGARGIARTPVQGLQRKLGMSMVRDTLTLEIEASALSVVEVVVTT